MNRYEVSVNDRCVAHCTSWEARTAALRLLFGTSLMLPPDVRTRKVNE